MRILNVISGLQAGGAETALARLHGQLDHHRFTSSVVSLSGPGPVERLLARQGVEVAELDLRHAPAAGLRALVGLVRSVRPDVVQTWLVHGDLLGSVAAALAGGPPVVWSLHQDPLSIRDAPPTTYLASRACLVLARTSPARIVCCSTHVMAGHARIGYPRKKMVVVPNGVDVGAFAPRPGARRELRNELGVPDGTELVGMVARFDPVKDHDGLLRAAAGIRRRRPSVQLVLVGQDISWDNLRLRARIARLGLSQACHLLGVREDVARILPGLDVAVCASRAEGFALAPAEAMACGVPCVVTDVGMLAHLSGTTGVVVRPGDAESLGRGIEALLQAGLHRRQELGARARRRVAEQFPLSATAEGYQGIWSEAAGRRSREVA